MKNCVPTLSPMGCCQQKVLFLLVCLFVEVLGGLGVHAQSQNDPDCASILDNEPSPLYLQLTLDIPPGSPGRFTFLNLNVNGAPQTQSVELLNPEFEFCSSLIVETSVFPPNPNVNLDLVAFYRQQQEPSLQCFADEVDVSTAGNTNVLSNRTNLAFALNQTASARSNLVSVFRLSGDTDALFDLSYVFVCEQALNCPTLLAAERKVNLTLIPNNDARVGVVLQGNSPMRILLGLTGSEQCDRLTFNALLSSISPNPNAIRLTLDEVFIGSSSSCIRQSPAGLNLNGNDLFFTGSTDMTEFLQRDRAPFLTITAEFDFTITVEFTAFCESNDSLTKGASTSVIATVLISVMVLL